MHPRRYVYLLLSLVAAVCHACFAQQFAPGQVIPSVATQADPTQTYALYLPSAYDAKHLWPAVFMFDPSAQGKRAVEAARAAAEQHGVILVASNVSKNGSMRVSMDSGQAMWNDATARFHIDAKRIYSAGFSGGARAATLFAKLCGHCISTVIASGAGYPVGAGPAKDDHFGIFLSAGDLDFNYKEQILLRDELDKIGVAHRSYFFHGPHQWTDTRGWNQAFDWIALREMMSGVLPKDDAKIKALLASFNAYAENLKAENDLVNALRIYDDNVRDFSGLTDVAAAIAARDAIRSDPTLAQQQKQEKSVFTDEIALEDDARRSFAAMQTNASGEQHDEALRDLRSRMASLRKKIDSIHDRDPIVERRALTDLLVGSSEVAEQAMKKGQYDLALELYTAMIDFAKSAPGAHLGKACALAKMGKNKDALTEAKLAIDAGLPRDSVRSAPELAGLIQKPEWQALLTSSN
jgi:dienelactone hydrolase